MKKTVFLTGGTGVMGTQTILKCLENPEEIHLQCLVRDSQVNRKKMERFKGKLEVIWGDLQDWELLSQSMKGVDYVLHVGALLSPHADDRPEETFRTNYGSTLAMLRGIKQFGQQDTTHFVYIGTVEETGDRMPPIHWGRIGDPLKPSVYAYYGMSKCAAERAVAESGLKYWVSIRQSYMNPTPIAGGSFPIISHIPFNCPAEHMDAESSGNLMRNICLDAPEQLWRKAYNLGGGQTFRTISYLYGLTGRGTDLRDSFEPNWLPFYNFHGQWYLDSDELERQIPHRLHTGKENQEMDQAYQAAEIKALMERQKAAAAADPNWKPPVLETPKERTRRVSSLPGGTLDVIEQDNDEGFRVWWGSKEKWEAIPEDWREVVISIPCDAPNKYPIDHGFDESKPVEELDLDDMRKAARFRGGQCLSQSMIPGDLFTPLKWKCAFGHEFTATPNLVLFLGHWCPDCMADQWKYGETADVNPFFAQVWTPLHRGEENYRVNMVCDYKVIDRLFEGSNR